YPYGDSCQSLEPLHPPPCRDRRQCHDRWLYHYRECGQAGGSTRPRPIAVEVWPYRLVARSGPTVTRAEWERALHERSLERYPAQPERRHNLPAERRPRVGYRHLVVAEPLYGHLVREEPVYWYRSSRGL